MIAVASLLLVVVISLVVTRVATVILTATGMSRASARFQARSAFTGAGFTTSESERVVDHPVRRRVIATLMLLGNAGIVAAASSTILGLRGGAIGSAYWRVLELVGGLLALVWLSRSAWVDRRLTALISRLLRRYTDLPTRDRESLLELSGDYAVSELATQPHDWVAERRLDQLELRREGVVVLGITRSDGRYFGVPHGSTVVHAGDVLVLYGQQERLAEIDHRMAGAEGDRQHEAAVRAHEAAASEMAVADESAGNEAVTRGTAAARG